MGPLSLVLLSSPITFSAQRSVLWSLLSHVDHSELYKAHTFFCYSHSCGVFSHKLSLYDPHSWLVLSNALFHPMTVGVGRYHQVVHFLLLSRKNWPRLNFKLILSSGVTAIFILSNKPETRKIFLMNILQLNFS